MKEAKLPLQLMSPHMRGPVVRVAQTALAKNEYGDFMEDGKIDGEFGPWTARATERAKYKLGFARPNQQYGEDLHEVLTGKKELTEKRKETRKQRRKEDAALTVGEKTWKIADQDVKKRVTESPAGSNQNYITRAYGLTGPWCAMAASLWTQKAGSKIPIIGRGYNGRYHYCPSIFADAHAGRNGLTLVKAQNMKRGDWVLFDWGDDRTADHVEIFGEWIKMAVSFRTIGGNTSYEGISGSQSDGGAAAHRTRSINDVARNSRGDYGFVRLER